jgi:hypothetical protein
MNKDLASYEDNIQKQYSFYYSIFSLDIEAFYPSVTYGLVKRAIEFFSSLLGEKEKQKSKVRLGMIAFGMGNTLLTFVDKYCNYNGKRNIRDKGLTIGGYKSAWLANLELQPLSLRTQWNDLKRPLTMASTEMMV